jgi:hypothetical protein
MMSTSEELRVVSLGPLRHLTTRTGLPRRPLPQKARALLICLCRTIRRIRKATVSTTLHLPV